MNPDDGLDPELLCLFDEAEAPPEEGIFVTATIARLEKARRTAFLGKLAATLVVMVLGAAIAPYVARTTLTAMGWLLDQLSQAGVGVALVFPIGCVCAALLAWRIARRRLN